VLLMKKEIRSSKGAACPYCSTTTCKCFKMEMIVWGIIALILGFLLWNKTLNLEQTVAIVLVLKGIFCLILGAKMKR